MQKGYFEEYFVWRRWTCQHYSHTQKDWSTPGMSSHILIMGSNYNFYSPKCLEKLLRRKEQPSDNVATEDIDNNGCVCELSLLNINVTSDDVQEWFHADGPSYEHLDDQSIIALAEKDGDEDV